MTVSASAAHYIANHVFFPPRLPQKDDYQISHEKAICSSILGSVLAYKDYAPSLERDRWDKIGKMLEHLKDTQEYEALSEHSITNAITEMQTGDIIALYIRAQNAGMITRTLSNERIFEFFEVSLPNHDVMAAQGKILRSFPGPAVAVPRTIADNALFIDELSSFLVQMNVDIIDPPQTHKAGSKVDEVRDTTAPHYITKLLTGILRGMGRPADIQRIQKRIAEDVLWKNAYAPWRRSPIWLIIRVALQTSLSGEQGRTEYKSFMVFALATMLQQTLAANLPSDVFFCMRSKICRRLYKLGSAAPKFVQGKVQEVGQATESLLQTRWKLAQTPKTLDVPWCPQNLDILGDTVLSLRRSGDYLRGVLRGNTVHSGTNAFQPQCTPRLQGSLGFSVYGATNLSQAVKSDPYTALADFEMSVQDFLEDWVNDHLHSTTSCDIIAACFAQYYGSANPLYKGNPELLSIMILTLAQLWVAVDRLVIAQCPLLREYSPEFPNNLLEPLLIRKSRALDRAKYVELYVLSRHHDAQPGRRIFTDGINSQTFAIRYFDSSAHHRALLEKINNHASSIRAEKLRELDRLNAQHSSLRQQIESMGCSLSPDKWGDQIHIKSRCHRCRLEKQANNLRITKHEWPLPTREMEAKAVVFELQCPPSFGIWRATTYQFLRDICLTSHKSRADPPMQLHGYDGLHSFKNQKLFRRISYASTTKSFAQSHYAPTAIPCSESSVCVNNGLTFRLFDSQQSEWAAIPFEECNITEYCTMLLPAGHYQFLQYAVESTSHTSNDMLAAQAHCPTDLSLHEYAAYAGLRAGPRLQWLNIARELHTGALTFRREEVFILLTQAVWEIGPLVDEAREWHEELQNAQFASVLLRELSNLLVTIQDNWAEVTSARILTTLSSRLLASISNDYATEQAYALMRKIRTVTFTWMRQLARRLGETEDEEKVSEFQRRICEVAVACRSTYDVDPVHLDALLRSAEDHAILLECTIVVHDNTPSDQISLPTDFKNLLTRNQRLSHALEETFLRHSKFSFEGLDQALHALWSGYERGSEGWSSLASPHHRWLVVNTASASGKTQSVQLNFLDGILLVDGKPLSRLPERFSRHPTYIRIFGQKVLDVIPADNPEMEFTARVSLNNHQVLSLVPLYLTRISDRLEKVSFAMRDSNTRLIIRMKRDSRTLELIPHEIFTNDLPSSFIDNHSHWMDLASGQVELRPLKNIWDSSPNNWVLFYTAHKSFMRKGTLVLADMHSPTVKMVHSSLSALDSPNHLVVTWSQAVHMLSAELPRLRLAFKLNEANLLESLNLNNMVVDENQSTGTMNGLTNQLVLREKESMFAKLPRSRRVIIPFGKINSHNRAHHVDISVDTGSEVSVKFYEYRIDSELGWLIGDGSLVSKLYQAYLHALSSHCLPDPLTGRTGTQEALYILRNAGCFSFRTLGPIETMILHSISTLAPTHIYYPKHLKVMQSVDWLDISALAQNQSFYWATQAIFAHAKRLSAFNTAACLTDDEQPSRQASDEHLQCRAARRMAPYIPDGTIDTLLEQSPEVARCTRDFIMDGAYKEAVAARVAAKVLEWPSTTLEKVPPLLDTLVNWGFVGSGEAALAYSRNKKAKDQFRLAFSLSAMAYRSEKNRPLVPVLLAFATNARFREVSLPCWSSYNLNPGFQPTKNQVSQYVVNCGSFDSSNESRLKAHTGETKQAHYRRRNKLYEARLQLQAGQVADHCMGQWPCETPALPRVPSDGWVFSAASAAAQIRTLFSARFQNLQFKHHVASVQEILDSMPQPTGNASVVGAYTPLPILDRSLRQPGYGAVTLDKLFQRESPSTAKPTPKLEMKVVQSHLAQDDTGNLRNLLAHFTGSSNSFERLYGDDLEKSRMRLMSDQNHIYPPTAFPCSLVDLITYGERCLRSLKEVLDSVQDALSPNADYQRTVHLAGQWSNVTLGSLLRVLGKRREHSMSNAWLKTLSVLAQRVLLYQRSQRLILLRKVGHPEDFFKEYENDNSDRGQEVYQTIDWLLIQIDGNFLARSIQIDVANEMISPASKSNSVTQLNMGEGKSSVIAPMVAATLADGHKLARVIVLKSLSGQMFQLLVERLSGLANRRIFYLPFSRSVKLGASQIGIITGLYEECVGVGGILVAQPEHILSFKLMGVERLLSSSDQGVAQVGVARSLLKVQRWLEGTARDLLDESDEILHVRYQLLYTVGVQQALEGHPDRWTTIQQLLSLVRKHAPQVYRDFPRGLELQPASHGRFPVTRILKRTAGNQLIEYVVEDVMRGRLRNCPFGIFPEEIRNTALRVIVKKDVHLDNSVKLLMDYCEGSGIWEGLLLLRGLFAHGILAYALKERRWRVDYGLDLSRSLLAVPYRAKDVPAVRAEFGHPDVAITLTCLSYLYGGLRDSELSVCFELLYKLDNPTMEYERWTGNDLSIPESFRHLKGINMEDPEQRGNIIFPIFRFNHLVIDFYLSQVVFPRAAKEFPHKLATSGWDLAEEDHLVTGFSGTNDNQHLLPTSITQCDPLGQLSTNAKVLTYLMRSENDAYMCFHGGDGERLSTKAFLKRMVQQIPEIRVLLDVGAQMLDMHNSELASHWLSLNPNAAAVIFFGDNDEMMVMTKDGSEPLISSPFRQQLEKCLVYLDDVHTRGTDLKLPRETRAAVTLGPKVTKDRLVQGCMRMRKLGNGQSVMFFAPPEVDEKIRHFASKSQEEKVETSNTTAPMWAEQGYDHEKRRDAWLQLDDGSSASGLEAAWLRPEAQTLAELYGDSLIPSQSHAARISQPSIDAIDSRCKILGVVQLSKTQMEEEHEREVDHEMETERQVERPPKVKACRHRLDPDIARLVRTGIIPAGSTQFIPAFSTIFGSPPALPGEQTWSTKLLATKDFSSTVQSHHGGDGEYLRPVNWILSSQTSDILVLLSPYEVHHLLPKIRSSEKVHLHIYAPRVTNAMETLEDLRFYCIPHLPLSWASPSTRMMNQLNLWAGQLYLMDYAVYDQLCLFLGLCTEEIQSLGNIDIQPDGFIKPEHRTHSMISQCAFAESPVPFLKNLIAYRRKGMGYSLTHMGKILAALFLTEDDFAE
ncbi:hypothetical protein HWV62_4707 [Athelia sp. TMB]|nr:hypothetical protein HWV62_4707 [Athelia sp. TMB]